MVSCFEEGGVFGSANFQGIFVENSINKGNGNNQYKKYKT